VTLASDGSGAFAYRVYIDTCPSEIVTHPSMTRAASAGVASRLDGLVMSGQEFSITADPLACKLTVGGLMVKAVDIGTEWSGIFDRTPSNVTWINGNVTASSTTIPVDSTAGFASAGYIWVDSECIAYTSTDATNFLGCTRASLSEDADAGTYHYTTDGARLRSPEVTDWPVMWEGRRVRVYRYEEGDDLTGDGTQCYLGLMNTSPQFNGKEWSFSVDSIASILDQTLGADLAEPCYPRGVTYTEPDPLRFTITESTSTLPGLTASRAEVVMLGFFESNDTFVDNLNTVIAAAQTAASQTNLLVAVSDGPSGWHLEFSTLGGGSARALTLSTTAFSVVDHSFGDRAGGPQNAIGESIVGTLAASTRYYFWPGGAAPVGATGAPGLAIGRVGIPGAGGVPRGSFDNTSRYVRPRTLYLDGSAPISSLVDSLSISWPGGNDGASYGVATYDGASRYIIVPAGFAISDDGTPRPGFHRWTPESLPEIRFGLLLCEDRLGSDSASFLDTIAAKQQQFSTLGVVPMLRDNDYDSAGWATAASVGQPLIVRRRVFSTFSPVSLGDIIREELKLAGCFLSVTSTGRLIPKRLHLPAASALSSASTIGQTTLLTDETLLSHEVSGLGQVNQVLMRTGYDAREDEYLGRTWITRDVAAFGQSPSVRQVTIEPKSEYVGPAITEHDAVRIASAIFGVFAGPYAVDTLDVAKHGSITVGDPIVFDHPHYPDGSGAIGVTGKVGLVIGKKTSAYSPRAEITCLTTRQKIGGYAPGALIFDEDDNGGNNWTLLMDDTTYPGATTSADWWIAGDRVRAVQFNTAIATSVSGTVVSSNATEEVIVQFDGAVVLGTGTWFLQYVAATDAALAETQKRFAFVATSGSVVEFDSGDVPPYRFGA
jgi:hypothetical protein